MPTETLERTFCRICEAHCGLVVKIEGEQVTRVLPDRDHPVSKGYTCVKGLGLGALHHDPDRVNHPLKKVDGDWQRISWDQALREIGQRIKDLRKAHGPRCIGMYQGNPTYFSLQNILFSSAFLEALHSPNIYASHSVDANNKFDTSTQVYGRSMVHPVPDLTHTQFFMCLGSNPVVSQMSVIHVPNAVGRLQEIEARGGRVIIVDPRRTETAKKVGEHLSIVPGTDVYLLLAMLHELVRSDKLDLTTARAVAEGVDAFTSVADDWSPERVAPLTGIGADQIRALAHAYADADGAALYMSTGVNMGPFGSIAYWLVQGLNLLTGNLDRRGGLLFPRGAFDAVKLAGMIGLGGEDEHRTLVNGWHRVAGCFPASALAEEMLTDHPQRLRALFVSAGNPVHSVPNGAAIARGLERMDLVVSIDLYRGETAEYADYVLPATDMLERSDFPASHAVLQETPHAQYTPALVSPLHERRPEWRIFSDLALACGASPFGTSACNLLPHLNRALRAIPGAPEVTPDTLLALLLRWGGKVTLKQLRDAPEGVLLGETPERSFLGRRVPTDNGKVQLYPPRLAADLPRLETLAPGFVAQDHRLVLIGRRERRTHNSWMHNNPHIPQPDGNRALLHPADAATRGIGEGDPVHITRAGHTVRLKASITDDVREGVVVVPHGWGHADTGLGKASALPGANINEVIPGGQVHMEPVSGQAIMLAHRVEVSLADVARDSSVAAAR